ncbi:hypothetical protein GQ600_11678 [Phytophthora cactorum]|nr:hypothetical protein GQ600_18725 [Phytophthora cactorum]KAF1780848.1 hypothetical protein GQ600_3540 [Phytophthora cactorum]KAF1780855.1 hypothetical protein GQ600_11678 [Phytophthora cactorum]
METSTNMSKRSGKRPTSSMIASSSTSKRVKALPGLASAAGAFTLRKECTEKNLWLPRTTRKPEQIKPLNAHDAACMAVQSTVHDEYTIEPSL